MVVESLITNSPYLAAMAFLLLGSAFFSASEAALFSLAVSERRRLHGGSAGHRAAARLLENPDQLLSAVLFWNLVVNVAYFALTSVVVLRLESQSPSWAGGFAVGALVTMILVSEMLPKSLAVLQAFTSAALVSIPLTVAVRAVGPIMPVLQLISLLSRRLIWPGFHPEPYLEVAALERAIRRSGSVNAIMACTVDDQVLAAVHPFSASPELLAEGPVLAPISASSSTFSRSRIWSYGKAPR